MAALEMLPELLSGTSEEARPVLAKLLGECVVVPSADKKTVQVRLEGHLPGLLTLTANKRRKTSQGQKQNGPPDVDDPLGNVVARARFELATFGL